VTINTLIKKIKVGIKIMLAAVAETTEVVALEVAAVAVVANNLATGKCSKVAGNVLAAKQKLLNFRSNQMGSAQYTAAIVIKKIGSDNRK